MIQHNEFPDIWNSASQNERDKLTDLMHERNLTGFRALVKTIKHKDLDDKPVRELISLCQRHRVPNYSRMQKEQMVSALLEKGCQ